MVDHFEDILLDKLQAFMVFGDSKGKPSGDSAGLSSGSSSSSSGSEDEPKPPTFGKIFPATDIDMPEKDIP
jgi:hypothetical protein